VNGMNNHRWTRMKTIFINTKFNWGESTPLSAPRE
jgi:hypothetical protein